MNSISIEFKLSEKLSGNLQDPLMAFMNFYTHAFNSRDIQAIENLDFRGGCPEGIKSTRAYLQSMFNCRLEVISWSAKPYKQPRWSIFKDYHFEPKPTVWVDVVLSDGKGAINEIFLALAKDSDGSLKSSYYVDN